MVKELREISDPEKIAVKVARYTQSFELLDRLGADNCVDPEDFDQEDLEDDLFKNLQIADLEEIFNKSEGGHNEETPRGPTQTKKESK